MDYNNLPSVEINSVEIKPYKSWADKVQSLTKAVLSMPQADVKFIHEFEEGKYIRTMVAPPNTVIVGAAHKTPYKVILKQGKIVVNVDGEMKTFSAPFEMDVPVGMERVGLSFDEEVIWTDIYDNPDNCQSIEDLEERLYIVPESGMLNHKLLSDGSSREVVLLTEKKEL